MEELVVYDWPGSVRQLEHDAHRLVYLCKGGQATDSSMLPATIQRTSSMVPGVLDDTLRLEENRATVERDLIRRALDAAGGNRTKASKLLGVSRNSLTIKMERLGISARGFKP